MSDKQDDSDSDALSNEIVRALGKELKRLRATHRDSEARIRDLEAQYGDLDARYSDLVARSSNLDARHNAVLARNTDLEGRNTELEGENARFQKELGDTRRALIATKVKEEDSEPCILAAGSPYEQAKRALDESMRQRKEERREHGHIVKSLQDKFAESDRRCAELARELVQAKRDLTLARQHVADTDSVAQSSSDDEGAPPVKARPPRYKAIVEKRMNDAEKTLSDSDVEGSDEGSDEESDRESDERSDAAPEESDDDESFTQLQDVDGFNLSHFLGNEAVNAFGVRESQVRVELPVKFKRQRALRALRKVLPQPGIVDHSLICFSPEIICSNETTRCLLILPSQLHDVNSGATTDIMYDDRIQEDQVCDLFQITGYSLFYRGTFRCTGQSTVSYRHLKGFIKGRSSVLNTIAQRTARSSRVSTLAVIQDMYKNGRLWIACYKLEKVGENHQIVNTIEAYEQNVQGKTRKRPSRHQDDGSRKKRKLA